MTTPRDLYIFGATPFAEWLAALFERTGNFAVRGHLLDADYVRQAPALDRPVLALDSLDDAARADAAVCCAVGYRSLRVRHAVFERLAESFAELPTLVADGAWVDPTAELGRNVVVLPGAVVEHRAVIGDNTVVWSNATVCHDTVVGDGCFVAANVTLGGNVRVGNLCFFGFSAVSSQRSKSPTRHCWVHCRCCGSPTAPAGKYFGAPARRVGEIANGIGVADYSPNDGAPD